MGKGGQNIVAMLRQFRNLCEEIHELLGTADRQIEEADKD